MQVVSFLKFLWAAMAGLKEVWVHIQEMDQQNVLKFSDAWWLSLRKFLENWLYDQSLKSDQGWRKMFASDNQLIRGGQLLLKSNRLADLAKAEGLFELKVAEKALREKTVQGLAPASDRGNL